ncbi:hypothetical protein RD110_16850 [Rhodoferax koreense]|uniref:Uncharacterized protein n=1 Tax=Rhodoferax koreensis TaxID=1842727 RepID=A0A1P8JY26_9BURK|nr:hypothetical protein [Rhodoferax koreense]APW38663.1 hypothetical protein RD110_16850 [Rhodoferax koreense]
MNMNPAARERHEEPEITQEESVPLDGRDHDGEEMMKQVRNPKLEQPAPDTSQAGKTPAGRSI